MYGAPVDLSFKHISSLAETWTEEPSSGLRPLKRNPEMKYLSCSLRLNNNNITDLHDLQKTVCHFLAEPSQLAWLDLSFNNISHIDQESRDFCSASIKGDGLQCCDTPRESHGKDLASEQQPQQKQQGDSPVTAGSPPSCCVETTVSPKCVLHIHSWKTSYTVCFSVYLW
ncbi:leucine rich repeat containing 51 isoform X2 [Sebastes umbrosus]|uniref:leucine rich repeat containing 51 isoform X2 n=1 Tax=Sebastes umbrosus TaxID=72105 RepID=UPI00189C9075|nr:leucine rich repeat containing 51 isoform X2 [Sebastes umbrosus]